MKQQIGVLLAVVLVSLGLFRAFSMTNAEEKFGERLNRIAKEINSKKTSWTAHDDGRFINVQKEHVQMRLGALKMERPEEFELIEKIENTRYSNGAPASFDSRTEWPNCQSIQEIRDQSDCGSCWAFASAETMSDRICIGSNQKDQTRISPADIMSCCSMCGQGCDGGYNYMAFLYWRYTGVVTGDLYQDNSWCLPYPFKCSRDGVKYPKCPADEYPTPACPNACNPSYPKSWSSDKHFAKHVYATKGATNIAAEIANNGPVATAFTVYEDFMTYKGGVYKHETGEALGGHAVKFIGYGTTTDGVDYWIVANSWDTTWGEDGFFRIVRGVNECGIEDEIQAGFPKL